MEAQPLQTLLLFSALLLLLSPYFAIAATETGEALITETCSKTLYPEDCIQALESNPGSLKADLPGLAGISIQVSGSKVKEAYSVTSKLAINAPSYYDRAVYDTCAVYYNGSISYINDGLQFFDQKKYKDAFSQVVNVNNVAISCNNFNMKPISQLNGALIRLTNNTGTILSLLF